MSVASDDPSAPRSGLLSVCLFGLATALMVVGIESGLVIRHIVQIVPIVGALAVSLRQPRWAAYAAIPMFAIWLLVSGLIWSFLLGISRVLTGEFTPVEIACTIVMGASGLLGITASLVAARPFQARHLATVLLGFALQVAAVVISVQPAIAAR
jgi:hypothetical protein